jgi:tetratricopeptide (TPR) repeat protein/S1-C subfamily serine protease
MSKYLSLLPILCLTLITPGSIEIAQSQPETRIDRTVAPIPKYTGIVKQVDDIAAQITVRIEDKEGNGSGVIVAREGNTYSVVTAAHVVKNKEGYSIITPNQERIVLKAEQVTILNKDLDVALVKFTSSQNYRVAELANYQFRDFDWVFVSGFPGRDPTRRRSLSIGIVWSKDATEFIVKNQQSFSDGNNLIYSNLSLPGMSGGGVLDREGRLVGINTGAENEYIINNEDRQEEINFGHSLGVSVPTILETFTEGKISTAQIKVVTSLPAQIAEKDRNTTINNLLSTISIPNQSNTGKEWLDYGNLLWRSVQYRQAIISFDRAIVLLKRGSTDSDKEQLKLAYVGKGLSLAFDDQQKEAIVAFGAAIAIDPNCIQAWRSQGRSLNELKQYEEALVSYRKAIELDPKNFVFRVEQGDVLKQLKRYPEAIDSYSQAIQLKPNHSWPYHNRGTTYGDLKQYDRAIADYDRAIKINPQYAEAYNNRGIAYKEQKQYAQAITDYDRAIKINPKYAIGYYNRAAIYNNLKQYSQAIADYDRAIKINPEYVEAYTNRGVVYNDLKQYSQAIADYDRAIKINPQHANSYYNRGNAYKLLEQYPQAMADYNQAIKLDPQLAIAYVDRGNVYNNLKQYSQTIIDYNRAIKLDPQLAIAYSFRGINYYELKQYEQGKTDLKKAAELFQQQDNQVGYQAVIMFLQQLETLIK